MLAHIENQIDKHELLVSGQVIEIGNKVLGSRDGHGGRGVEQLVHLVGGDDDSAGLDPRVVKMEAGHNGLSARRFQIEANSDVSFAHQHRCWSDGLAGLVVVGGEAG